MPSLNQGRFIAATLDSVLSQRHRPLEVVVVDGASSDGTVAILERYAAEHPELRWISEPDDGPADAVNKGLAMATGSIAGIQSSDDLYLPGAVDAAVRAFAADPGLGIAYGDATSIDEDGTPSFSTSYLPFTLERFLCGSTFIQQSSAFFRTELARRLGGWRPDYYVMDVDLWLRMAFRAPVRKLPVVLSGFRRHGDQRDQQVQAIAESYRRMLVESPDVRAASWRRRRAAAAGWRMLAQHYPAGRSHRQVLVSMWSAIVTYPPAIRAVVDPHRLLPGRLRGLAARFAPRHRRRRPNQL